MRFAAPMVCLAVAVLIAGSPGAWGGGSEHKADAHGGDAPPKDPHAKKDKHAAPEQGKEAAAPPPPRVGCYYDPNAPLRPPADDHASASAPDGHGKGAKTEHSAAPAPENTAHPAPDAHGKGAKTEHSAAPPVVEHADHPAPTAPAEETKVEHSAAPVAPPAVEHAGHPSLEAPAEETKVEHSAVPSPPPAVEQAHPAPDAHAEETKAEQPAAASAGHDDAAHALASEAAAPESPPAHVSEEAAAKTEQLPDEPVAKKDEAEQPYMLIRTLEAVQDKIAGGSSDAHIYQRQLIAEISKKLPRVSDEDWKQPRNSRGAIIYALSGGDPGVLAKLLSISPVPCVDDNLVKGLLDYSQGRNTEAIALLSKIDARTLDARAGGHLALAQAMLVSADDPKRAIAYLDLARLLAPGTLVEEAALRRGAVIAALGDDLDKFKLLTSQYLRRYSKSVYASDFIRRFATVVTTGKFAENPSLFSEVAEALDMLDKDEQKRAYSAIAEAGIVRGRVQLTLLAAKKLADQAKDDPKRAVQARLYEAAALLVTDDFDRAVIQLKSIDRAALGARDQPLLDAALTVANKMRAPLPEAIAGGEPPPVSAEQGRDVELSQAPAVIGKANKAIGKVDELLDGDKR